MHVHGWSTSDHALFVANGVATVRNKWGGAGPLEWRASRRRAGVLRRGRWFPEATLQSRLEQIAGGFAAARREAPR